jgi:transcription initiation factor TFIIB
LDLDIVKMPLCSRCNKGQSIITDPQSGEIICGSCGLVVLDKIPLRGPEWGTFITNGAIVHNKSRTGIPSSLARYDMGLSTVIGCTNKDSSRHRLDEAMHSRMQRLSTWDSRPA